LGWVIDFFGYFFVSRDWKIDKSQINWQSKRMVEEKESKVYLLMFPEGTDFTPAKLARANRFAESKLGIKEFKYVLTPRLKGFETTLQALRPRIDAIYDLTIAYEDGIKPTLWSVFCGSFPKKMYVHVRRFPCQKLPQTSNEINQWTLDLFREKDELIDKFKSNKYEFFVEEDEQTKKNKEKLNKNSKSKLDIIFFGLFWMFLSIWLIYVWNPFGTNKYILSIQILSWIYFACVSISAKIRRFIGYEPPNNMELKKE